MRVNEESAATFTFRPLDEDGKAVTPNTMRYRVDDLSSSTELVAWTNVTPATEVEVTVPATVHSMINAAQSEEVKVVTVQTDYDTSIQTSEEYQYTLVNLSFAEVAS
jgi:hypothetical protein